MRLGSTIRQAQITSWLCHLLCDFGDFGENYFSEPPFVIFFKVKRIAATAGVSIRTGNGMSQC